MNTVARLAIPAFFTLVAEPLFLLADSAIVGHLGTRPLAALGVASTLLLTATGVFVFLAYATTAVVAQAKGAGRPEAAIAAGFDGIWLAAIISVPLAIVLFVAAPALSLALGGAELAPDAVSYLRVSAFGLPAMLISLAVQGLLRGLQDTTTPLWATTVSFALNAVLNATFVLVLGWGLAGSAAGTVIAQWLLTALMLTVVLRRAGRLHLTPHLGRVLASAKVGAPLFIRTIALRAVLLLTTAAAAKFGAEAMAAHQIVSTVFSFLTFALDALAIAAQAMTGEALGRQDSEGVSELTRKFIRLGWQWGLVATVLLAALSPFLPHFFTGDDVVRNAATVGLLAMALVQPIAGIVFVLDGVLMGAGDGVYLAKAQLAVLVAYVPFIAALMLARPHLVAHGVAVCVAVTWVVYNLYIVMRWVALDRRRRGTEWMQIELPTAG